MLICINKWQPHKEWLQLACRQVLYLTSSPGLGGHQQSFLEVGIQGSQHGTRISSIRLLDPPDHKPSTRLGSQGGVPIHIPDDGGIGGIRDWNKEQEMLEKMEMGEKSKECLTEMSEN